MRNPFKKGTAENFFWSHAGYCYDPKTETREQGRKNCAIALATAERQASDAGFSFAWSQDDITDEDFRETDAPYYLWQCLARDLEGKVIGSLGGVDFGALPSDPWMHPYRRVCEAEIASEALTVAETV